MEKNLRAVRHGEPSQSLIVGRLSSSNAPNGLDRCRQAGTNERTDQQTLLEIPPPKSGSASPFQCMAPLQGVSARLSKVLSSLVSVRALPERASRSHVSKFSVAHGSKQRTVAVVRSWVPRASPPCVAPPYPNVAPPSQSYFIN